MTKQKRFYVPPEWESILKELEEILDREHKSFSQWVRDLARSYVDLHRPGNPQQRLDTIMDLGKAYNCKIIRLCQHPVFLRQRVECAFEACPLIARKNLLFSSDKEMYTCQWRT